MDYITQINEATNYIKKQYNKPIDLAIVLGSGLHDLIYMMSNPLIIDYHDIPYFPVSTIEGHEGKLYIGQIENKTVCAMSGRFHYYEGYDMKQVTFPIRVFKKLGIEKLILTNACGGIREDLNPGDIVLLKDHITLFCPSPLIGPNLDEFGPRFKDMTEVYTKDLRNLALNTAKDLNIEIKTGIYGYYSGPQFESPADIQALKIIGSDLAGMSTVPEAIVARHSDMNTLGISLVTNKAAGLSNNELSHQEVQEAADKASQTLITLVKNIIINM